MELGRELLRLWGYTRVDELIWVKTNQLQRLIRTGRTGHWLNHGKEHCLVGIKGQPKNLNRGLDCDVLGKCFFHHFQTGSEIRFEKLFLKHLESCRSARYLS